MNCNIFKEKGILYLYGELNEREMQIFRQHIESCPYCKEEIAGLKETISVFREKNMDRPGEHIFESIAHAGKEKKSFFNGNVLSFNRRSPVFTFCSIAVLLMIGFLFFYGKDLGFLRKEVFWQLEDEIEAVRIEVDGYVDVFDEEINAYSASFFNTEMEEIETKINELWIEMDEV